MDLKVIGHLTPRPDWKMKSHAHRDYHELIVIIRGKMHLHAENLAVTARQGDLLIYPRNCVHEEASDSADPVESIYFAFIGDGGRAVRLIHDRHGRISILARLMLELELTGNAQSVVLRQAYFDLLIAELNILENTCEPRNELVEKIRTLMNLNTAKNLTVSAMAAQVNLSKYHFIRVYKKLRGTTPLHDFRRLRLSKAETLLQTTNLPLKVIAPMTGFADEYHLSRVFKQIKRISPGRFRKTTGRP